VHHPDIPGTAGATFELDEQESHHVRRVLRLGAGEHVSVFDGEGGEWRAVIAAGGRKRVTLQLEHPVADPVEAPLEVVLYQALCRTSRMEWVLQKATEVGVSAVHTFATARSGAYAVKDQRLARWRRVVVEACKQSGRRRLPRIEVRETLPPPPPGTLGVLLDPRPAATPLGEVVARNAPPGAVWLAVGPESGFEEPEVASWTGCGWQRAGLGPRTLRSDTAGVVVASILLHLWGDLGSARDSCRHC
jgi:16S rRNA (uracil1498-N3)-methyltransferase